MAEYASKGLANGVGIPALVLGSLGFLQSGGLGGLGGLFGNNMGCANAIAERDSRIAQLQAEKYADSVAANVYKASRDELSAFSDRVFDKYIAPLSQEVADMRVREARMEGRINEVSLLANNGLTALTGQVNCLAQTVAGISKTVVPITAVCPQPMPLYNSWATPTAPTTTG